MPASDVHFVRSSFFSCFHAAVVDLARLSLNAAQPAVLQQLVRRNSHDCGRTEHAGRVGQDREFPGMAKFHLHRALPVYVLHG